MYFLDLNWTRHKNYLGGSDTEQVESIQKEVTRLINAPKGSLLGVEDSEGVSKFSIIVSTVESDKVEGSKYIIDPSKTAAPWKNLPIPREARKVLQCEPAIREGAGAGLYVLSTGGSNNEKITCTLQCDGVASSDILFDKLQEPKSITSSVNVLEFTDLLVSTKAGIAYYSYDDHKIPHGVLLPETSFSKSVCYEVSTNTDYTSKIAIFGLSDIGDVYYIEGTRDYSDESETKIEFLASGLPIRSNVKVLSGIFNKTSNTVELVFANNTDTPGSEEIIYLKRDPVSYIWNESRITVPSDRVQPKYISLPAYMTTINLDNGLGQPLPIPCAIEVSSISPMQVMISGRRYTLNKDRQVIKTGEGGNLKIVIPAENGSFACNDISFRIGSINYEGYKSDAEYHEGFSVTPSERIIRMMGNVRTKKDIINATTSDGRPVFSGPFKANDDVLDQTAALLSAVPALVKGKADEGDILAILATELGSQISAENLLPDDTTIQFFGDAIRAMKTMVKSRIQAEFKIIKGALQFVLGIAGKIYRFYLDTTKALIGGIISFLENVVGLDLSKLKDWWELHFCKVEKAQKILAKTISTGFTAVQLVLKANENEIMKKLDIAEKAAEEFLGRPRPKPAPPSLANTMADILNNPIIQLLLEMNPMTWIMEAFQEGSDDLKESYYIPSLPAIGSLVSLLSKFASQGIQGLLTFVWNILQNVGLFLVNPDSAIDLLLDSMKEYLFASFDMAKSVVHETLTFIRDIFKQIDTFIEDIWRLPPMTDMWYDMTGCKFSLLNGVTYLLAQLIEYNSKGEKDWFDGIDEKDIHLREDIPDKDLTFFGDKDANGPSDTTSATQRSEKTAAISRMRMLPPLADTEKDIISESNKESLLTPVWARVVGIPH
ncbi:hypothetical protein ABW20_dc0102696 [Dactylellina cionopaga]|nr:hypothetical protein ABW20_dc0102696 [Dactylellina cionopaga]